MPVIILHNFRYPGLATDGSRHRLRVNANRGANGLIRHKEIAHITVSPGDRWTYGTVQSDIEKNVDKFRKRRAEQLGRIAGTIGIRVEHS